MSIAAYCALAAEFLSRFTWDRPVRRSAPVPGEVLRGTADARLNRMLYAMFVMTIFIFIRYFLHPFCMQRILIVCRTIYRVVEFVSGWNGTVVSTQWLFSTWLFIIPCPRVIIGDCADVFDGTMITLAMFTLNFFHPGIYLQESGSPSPTSSEGIDMEDRLKMSVPLERVV